MAAHTRAHNPPPVRMPLIRKLPSPVLNLEDLVLSRASQGQSVYHEDTILGGFVQSS